MIPTDAHLETFSKRILAFCQFLRQEGFKIGLAESRDALRVVQDGHFVDKRKMALLLKIILCGSPKEWATFDGLFRGFWDEAQNEYSARKPPQQMPPIEDKKTIPLLMIGAQGQAVSDKPGKSTSGANTLERLRKTDFSQVSIHEQKQLERLVLRLCQQMNHRLTRRRKHSTTRSQVDLRRTIRNNLSQGGDPIRLAFKSKRRQKNRLVTLLDISGSMDQYSFFLLLFTHALKKHFKQVDSFVFSTQLTCVNEAFTVRKLREVLQRTSQLAQAWSSGTRIGACFETFNQLHGKQLLRPDTIVFILSDGLDTGEPETLRKAMAHMKSQVKSIIWLNPLKGMSDYEPLAQGMQAALPYLDVFASAHNLDSLLGLEKHLAYD